MTAILDEPAGSAVPAGPAGPAQPRPDNGGRPARRAVARWAWRLYRREWRRQVLILTLLTLAVGATVVGLAVASNAVVLKADPTFGTANTILNLRGSDPNLSHDLAAIRARFGAAQVVEHATVAIPGSVSTIDVRAEDLTGAFLRPTVRLDQGHLPTGPGQVAVTTSVEQAYDLHLGGAWNPNGQSLTVVGIVENPLNLLDDFALVTPGAITSPSQISVLVNATSAGLEQFHLDDSSGPLDITGRGTGGAQGAQVAVLALATLGMIFVGLLAVAGFTVLAQRRMRSLGILGSLGATDRQLRLVLVANGAAVGLTAAVVGTAAGLLAWFAFAPVLVHLAEHRVDRLAVPWWAIGADMVLALVTAVVAGWWPARAVARIPVVAALSGRPPRPRPPRRFAAAGVVVLGGGVALLAFAHQRRPAFIICGILACVVGTLLLAPLAIRVLAAADRRAPIATRLALRDLVRFQARSGAALGAVTLAIGIAATIAISAAAAQAPAGAGNLPANEMAIYLAKADLTPQLDGSQVANVNAAVNQIAGSVHAHSVLALEEADDPTQTPLPPESGPGGGQGGQPTASLSRVRISAHGEEITEMIELYVATPEVLAHYGIAPSAIRPDADILSGRSDLGGLSIFMPRMSGPAPKGAPGQAPGQGGGRPDGLLEHPVIQHFRQLPQYGSGPSILITPHAMATLRVQALPGAWMIDAPSRLTTTQINAARRIAGHAGLYVESRKSQGSIAKLRDYSTATGILIALGVLAATVGLIRSETAGDVRTLTATGATSNVRRALTGVTAGALALLGAVLGTAAAYAALLAWHRSNLHPLTRVPLANLVVIVAVLPVVATAAGCLLAGKEPAAITRRVLD